MFRRSLDSSWIAVISLVLGFALSLCIQGMCPTLQWTVSSSLETSFRVMQNPRASLQVLRSFLPCVLLHTSHGYVGGLVSVDRAYLVLPLKFWSLRTQAGAMLSNSWRFLKHTRGIGLSPSLSSGYEVKKWENSPWNCFGEMLGRSNTDMPGEGSLEQLQTLSAPLGCWEAALVHSWTAAGF